MYNEIFLIEGCNFIDYPKGGQLSFCTQLLEVFPEYYFNLVGFTTDPSIKTGKWQIYIIDGKSYNFFPVLYIPNKSNKGIIPGRLKFFIALFINRNKLFKKEMNNHLITHAPETLLALKLNKSNLKILHFMHGIENPLAMSRFKWAVNFADLFWKYYLKRLLHTEYIAATADKLNIEKFHFGNNFKKEIDSFPNRFDDKIFKPSYKQKPDIPTFIYCGRINQVKGWELLIHSFNNYLKSFGEAKLIIVGDGEDRIKLEHTIQQLDISKNIIITGFLNKKEIVVWLNRAHVFLLPSYREGWSIAMVEALGCGLPVVSTNVSGASQMIKDGINGFIVNEYDAKIFAYTIRKSLELKSPNLVSLNISENYRQSILKTDLIKMYPEFFNNL